jgi:hypothetical protein
LFPENASFKFFELLGEPKRRSSLLPSGGWKIRILNVALWVWASRRKKDPHFPGTK